MADMIAEHHRSQRYVIASGKSRIRPRARLIRTIGAELISSEIVAVIELVRNSYDADATKVEIRFESPHRPADAKLTILDDGHGMTRETFLGPWLEPATDHKSSQGKGQFAGEQSPKGRRRLGSKGVGRFAAQRLGEHLVARSRSSAEPGEFEADFDWNLLDNGDRYLDELVIPWRELEPQRVRWHGTALSISKLRDQWTEERFERLRLALSRLLGPGLGDDFHIHLTVDGQDEEIKPFIDSLPAMYSIEGHVLDNGTCSIIYRDVTGTEESWQRSVLWHQKEACGPFSFRINSWDLDREALEYFFKQVNLELGLREFRRTIRDHSGISLYRDGFRILPYGEPDNDWLRLDRRRVNNPTLRLSNNQILGWIKLSADENPLLQDQTNREGLVSNRAYNHLQQALLELISYLEVRRFTARRSFGSSTRTTVEVPSPIQVKVDDHIESLVATLTKKSNGYSDVVPALREALRKTAESQAGLTKHYLHLAGAGSLVPLVVADLHQPLRQASGETSFLLAEVEACAIGAEMRGDLIASLEKLHRSLQTLKHRVDLIDSMRPAQAISWARIPLSDCIETIGDLFLQEFVRSEIDFDVDIGADPAVLIPPPLFQQVLALLFDNAVHWLKQIKSSRKLVVRVKPYTVLVENNGPIVPKEFEERIFEAGFTTRDGAAGLGLALARDLLNSIGGNISYIRRPKHASFEIALPNHG